MVSTKPASGMRDFLPGEMARRDYALACIRGVYERHHFQPIETPALERIDVLTDKYGEEGEQLIFKVLKRGEKIRKAIESDNIKSADLTDMGLRYDLTVPLCRVVAQHQHALPRIFKCYQIRPVWRADRPAKGRYREFYQCDVDVVGSDGHLVEVDVVTAACEALDALGVVDYQFKINDRSLLAALTDKAGISGERSQQALISLDKLDKIGAEGVRKELVKNGFEEEAIQSLFLLLGLKEGEQPEPRSLEELAAALGSFAPEEAVKRLGLILNTLRRVVSNPEKICFDPALARGTAYYTGPIFEIVVEGFSGSIGGGGRYDGLIGLFSGKEIPACGISLGFERLLLLMEERGLFPEEVDAGCDLFVAQFPGVDPVQALLVAGRLRKEGYSVNVSPEAARMKKQFKQAEERGARAVMLIGPEEEAAGNAVIKSMVSGEQHVCPVDGVVDFLGSLLSKGTV